MPTKLEQKFAWFVRQQELVPDADLQQILNEVDQMRGRLPDTDLRTVLIGRKLLDRDAAEEILGSMDGIVMRCKSCGREYGVRRYKPGKAANCPHDQTALAPTLAPRAGTMRPSGDTGVTVPTAAPGGAMPGPLPPGQVPTGRQEPIRMLLAEPNPDFDKVAQLLENKVIGNFRLDRMVAKGTASMIFRGTMEGSGEPCAVKLLVEPDDEKAKRFIREAEYATRIDHPNVVAVHEIGQHAGLLYIAMEFVEGRTLHAMLEERDGPMDIREAVGILLPALEGLGAAHNTGVIHRDMKPGNIMVGNVDVKLLDLGTARAVEGTNSVSNLTMEGETIGTPDYIAPEQVSSSKVDERADLYAFGATAYLALTGQKPFTGRTMIELVMARLNSDPAPPREVNPAISEALDAVIRKLMAREADDRYQSADEAVAAMRAAV